MKLGYDNVGQRLVEVGESTLNILRRMALSSYPAWCATIFMGGVIGIALGIVTSTWVNLREGWQEVWTSLSRETFHREARRRVWEGRRFLNDGRRL